MADTNAPHATPPNPTPVVDPNAPHAATPPTSVPGAVAQPLGPGPGRPRTVRDQVAPVKADDAAAQAAHIDNAATVLAAAIHKIQTSAPAAPAVTRTEGIDEADAPGGCYLVEGRYVNAWGQEVDAPDNADQDPLNVKRNAAADKFKAAQDRGEGFDQHGNPVSEDAKARAKVRQ